MLQSQALRSMPDYLADHAARHPQREAAVDGELRLSYRQLADAVEIVASCLAERGIGAGHVLAYIGPPGVQYLVSLLAAFRNGATWLGLNPRYRAGELAYAIDDARPCAVLVAHKADAFARRELAAALAICNASPTALALEPGVNGMAEVIASGTAPLADPSAAQPDLVELNAAVLVYTSGSTGKPKGACLTQANLVENAWWLVRRLADEGGRFLINLPINHAGCIADTTLVALLQGDTLVFMSEFDPVGAAELIRAERITTIGQVPTQYQMMAAAAVLTPAYLGSVRHLAWGGAAMPLPLIEALNAFVPDLFNSYGLTESPGTVTVTRRGASIDELAHSVGRPVFDGALRIVDAEGMALGVGQDGEVQIRGPHVFPGYLRKPEATASALGSDGWLHTGDVGQWLDDGNLRLVGRKTEMYKSGGYNIFPREVEVALEAHPQVLMAAVIGMPDPLWGEAGCAFVQADPAVVNPALLAAWCRERMAAYKVPKRFEIRAALPLLPIGKVDRKQLLGQLDER